MIRNKTIKFNLDNPNERVLWEKLQKLPHGEFSHKTKEYWVEELLDDQPWKYKIEIGKNVTLEEAELAFEDIRKKIRKGEGK